MSSRKNVITLIKKSIGLLPKENNSDNTGSKDVDIDDSIQNVNSDFWFNNCKVDMPEYRREFFKKDGETLAKIINNIINNPKDFEIHYDETNEKAFFENNNIKFSEYFINIDKFNQYFSENEKIYLENHYAYPEEKALEHFLTTEVLDIKKSDLCIDIGSCGSPCRGILNKEGYNNIWNHDINLENNDELKTLNGWADNLSFENDKVNFVFAHCSIDNFEGKADIDLLKEIYRILKPGGKFLIIPFYLGSTHNNNIDISTIFSMNPDNEALINFIEPFTYPFGRNYSYTTFIERLVKPR
jgi:hypothetical protein